ncbi:MAG: alpha/beta hydrolase [Kordiimonadaceae bacterium]|nr:alpha/beta hydrolase [Kordiimonadaceae bacterium]MBO6569197.1 alpha/beta hydrolase [Kordiimonadaceae bacterium]MBO6964673.1 alpha/beta hydrolase [Kordiimonadaceae bacterium]
MRPSQAMNLRLMAALLSESRAIFEFNAFFSTRLLMRAFPKGDGHPVLFLPGFMASDFSTGPMRRLFKDLGYVTSGWELGRNVVVNEEREAEMQALLRAYSDSHGRKVSIVGWSLGGVFAREIAKAHPECVRQVISLGSPISGHAVSEPVDGAFMAVNGTPNAEERKRRRTLGEAPPVPTTSIYSKTDSIVAWRRSVQKQQETQTENIEVPASHLGLGVNPLVMYAIADRLAQPEGDWKPFDKSGAARIFFK